MTKVYEKSCIINRSCGVCPWFALYITKKAARLIKQIDGGSCAGIYIRSTKNNDRMMAESILSVMMLRACHKDELFVFTDDPRYNNAVDELASCIENINDDNFREILNKELGCERKK